MADRPDMQGNVRHFGPYVAGDRVQVNDPGHWSDGLLGRIIATNWGGSSKSPGRGYLVQVVDGDGVRKNLVRGERFLSKPDRGFRAVTSISGGRNVVSTPTVHEPRSEEPDAAAEPETE